MDDGKIVELFWARAETAITETAKKYAKYCFRISYTILQNGEDAEECVNDTYLKAWNAIPPHRPNQLSAFLGKITRNLSLQKRIKYNAQKRGGGQVELALSELEECIPARTGVEQAAEDQLLAETLDAFLRGLQKETRVVIPYGDVPFLYGYVASELLSTDLERGNQAIIRDCECYDSAGGSVIQIGNARVAVQSNDGEWACVAEYGTGAEPYWVRSEDLSFDFDEIVLDLPE